jgi:F5/8 type C domain
LEQELIFQMILYQKEKYMKSLYQILVTIILAGLLSSGCLPPAPRYPNEPPDKILRDAQRLSDSLEWYVKQWLDGKVPAQIPARYIPDGITDSKNFYLKHPDSVTAAETWATRFSHPVNLDSCLGGIPDPHATYYLMGPGLAPFGSKLVLEGEFPHCRFFSIQVSHPLDGKHYTATRYFGSAEVSWADADIDPLPGHINPFRVGADRNASNRKYRVEIRMAKGDPVALNKEAFKPLYREQGNIRYGSMLVYQGPWGEKDFFLKPKKDGGRWNLGNLWVRVYAPDKDKGAMGGVALPKMHFELPDGRKYFIGADFTELKKRANATMKARLTKDPQNIYMGPETGWFKSWGILKSILHGACQYNGWNRQINTPKVNAVDLGVSGRGEHMPAPGNYEPSATGNNYVSYIGRGLNLQKGQVAVLIGKMPTFPATRNGEPTLTKAQVRYWSICGYDNSIEASLPGSAINGIMDEDIQLDKERNYMIAYSRPEDKPSNIKGSNITWVNWGPTTELGLIIRYLTVSPEWDFELSPNEKHLTAAKTDWTGSAYDSTLIGVNSFKGFMQCYLPRIVVMSREQFEAMGNNLKPADIPAWMDESNRIGVSEARNKPAAAGSVWGNEYQYQPDKAFDGKLTTRWSSKFGEKNSFLSVDLGRIMPISGVKLFWEAAAAKAYSIDVSDDGINWKTVYATTRGNGGVDAINRLKTSGRFVRMNATKSWWGSYSLWEMEVVSPEMPCATIRETGVPIIEAAVSETIRLYPNPARSQTIVNLGSILPPNNTAAVEVFAANGRLMYTQRTANPTMVLNCFNWLAGMYYVQVRVRDKVYRAEFMKV